MRRIAVALVGALVVLGCSGRKRATTSTDEAGSWSTVGIGSVFVTRTITHLQQPFVHETETTMTQTLLARDAAEASVKLVIAEGANTSTQDVKVPLRQAPPVAPHDGSTLNSTKGTAGLLLRDTTLYRNLVGITQGADSLMRSLTNGQGTASKLLTDQTLYDQLNKLVTDLSAILADVRRDPSRYMKGMIKVF